MKDGQQPWKRAANNKAFSFVSNMRLLVDRVLEEEAAQHRYQPHL